MTADESREMFSAMMSTVNTDSYLDSLQTSGDSFKQLLKAAKLAADVLLSPVMFFDNRPTHTQVCAVQPLSCTAHTCITPVPAWVHA